MFLVALGIDYNIFLMTRVREETLESGTRQGVLRGLAVTGGVITSAGVVLAATFAVLGVLPLVFLAEIGFAVAFGVLLDTIVVRSILVPALSHDIGKRSGGRRSWPRGRLTDRPERSACGQLRRRARLRRIPSPDDVAADRGLACPVEHFSPLGMRRAGCGRRASAEVWPARAGRAARGGAQADRRLAGGRARGRAPKQRCSPRWITRT